MAGEKKCPPSGEKKSGSSEKSSKSSGGKKPVMRGLHIKQSLTNVYIALSLSALTGTLFYFLHNQRRKNLYKDFYATYDAEASFKRMRAANLFDGCPPEPPPDPKKK